MHVEAQVDIDGPREAIWSVITDIENATENISGIDKVEILEKPAGGFVGLKWRETRTMFGKTATEVMWITDASENESYRARAESHGFIFESSMKISPQAGGCSLTMTHDSKPAGLMAKVLGVPMGWMCKGMMKKALQKDLEDIKGVVERQTVAG